MKSRPEFHDTEALPPGGFFFAPGAIDDEPRRRKRLTERQRWLLAYACMALVAVLIGIALGHIDAKGWLL